METRTKLKQAKFFLGRQWTGVSSTRAEEHPRDVCLQSQHVRTTQWLHAKAGMGFGFGQGVGYTLCFRTTSRVM